MPITRSDSKKKGRSEGPSNVQQVAETDHTVSSDDTSTNTDANDMLVHIEHIQGGVKKMQKDLKNLRRQNDRLQKEIEAQRTINISKGKQKTGISAEASTSRIKALEDTIEKLQKANKNQAKKIQKLRAKEAEAEIKDLTHPPSDDELGDPNHLMRKLLRRFDDLMLITALGESEGGEICPICFDEMKLKKCSSFPCQHLVCNTCLPNICKGADETVQCPSCRRVHPRDEVELVYYTESGRWDALLDVAKAWAAFDHRGEEETSEEEREEDFLTDGNGSSEITSQPVSENAEEENADVSIRSSITPASTPPPEANNTPSYSQSPAHVKRRMLEQLANERKRQKKR